MATAKPFLEGTLLDLLQKPTLTDDELADVRAYFAAMPDKQRISMAPLLKELLQRKHLIRAKEDFYYFCKRVRPNYIEGAHLQLMCEKLTQVADGKLKRLIIAMPPRHSKSEHTSKLFPAFFLGRHPDAQIITASHTADLAKNFGRAVRDLIDTSAYQEIFGKNVSLRPDVKAAGQWITSQQGMYYAAGVGGALAGRGATLLVLDDLIDEQSALQAQTKPGVFEAIFEWYLLVRQRLMPGGAIVVCATRWALNDPTGLILERSKEDWEILTLPAIWSDGRTLWPEFWPKDEIYKMREEMPPIQWAATFQQAPEEGGATLVKAEWIKDWDRPKPPKPLKEIIITIDPAFSEATRADPSGIVVSGVFELPGNDEEPENHLVVLDAYETRENFPDMKATCYDLYKQWKPSVFLIEDKASGIPLIQELNSIGVPVQAYKVTRGSAGQSNDKIARVNSVLPTIQDGHLWVPMDKPWANKLVSQLTRFPQVVNDDLVDALTMALKYFRDGGYISLSTDNVAEEHEPLYQSEYKFGGYGGAVFR